MTRYTDKARTPLAYHTFFRYVALPLGILTTFANIFQEFGYFNDFQIQPGSVLYSLFITELLFYFIDLALLLVCFVGFFHWSRYAWYSTMIHLVLAVIYRLYVLVFFAVYNPTETSSAVSDLIAALLLCVLLGIYYWKRKPLFFPVPPDSETSPGTEPTLSSPSLPGDSPRAIFCRKCGQRLPPDGAFCPQCGTPIKRETPQFK